MLYFSFFILIFASDLRSNMAKRSIVFIINPISGTQSKDNIIELISQHLDQDKFNYQVVRTEYAGHATLLAQEHVENPLRLSFLFFISCFILLFREVPTA